MNYQELKRDWKEWSHRPEITDTMLDTVQRMATSRLGRDLRTHENTAERLVSVPEDGYPLNGRVKQIQQVSDAGGTLCRYVPPSNFRARLGGKDYTVRGGRLVLSVPGDVTMIYWEEPDQLVADADSNAVLEQWPSIYLYAGLVEIFRYTQDAEAVQIYMPQYRMEIAEINKQAQAARVGNAPVMGAR